MRSLRVVIGSAVLGIASALLAIVPAGAAETAAAVPAASSAAVIGESWSSPAFPVDCKQADRQIACTPQAPTDVKAMQCFTKVIVDGAGVTVCTTYASHVDAIKGAGGRPMLVEYGCSVGDVVCITFENAGRGMAISATGAMFAVAQNMRFDTSTVLWSASTGEWAFWQWAILAIVFGAMVWAIAAAIVSGDRAELIGAILRSFIAIPAVPISLWLTGHLLNAIDELTWYIMQRDGAAGLFTTLQGVMWAGGQANYFFAFLIHGLLMIGMLLLMLVFAFRNIVLAALIAVGPVAWMLFPVRGVGPQWVVRYVSAVVVLLLTGPLTIGFVTLIIQGLADVSTIWDPQSWPLIVGLLLVAFAPFAVFGLFSFVGAAAADSVGSQLGWSARQSAGRGAAALGRVPSRISARPAGAPTSASTGRSPASGVRSAPPRGPAGPAGASDVKAATPNTSPISTTPSASNATPPRPAERTA